MLACTAIGMCDSPLHLAIRNCSPIENIETVLATGIKPNLRNQKGKTALYLAIKIGGNSSVISTLLNAGANPDIPCATDMAPLHRLLYYGSALLQKESLSVLLHANVDLEKRNHKNRTPLEFAANQYARAMLVRMLLEAGASLVQ